MFLFKTDLQNHECDDKSDDQGHDKTSRRHFHIGDVTGFARSGLRVYLQQFHAKADPLHAIPSEIGFSKRKVAGILCGNQIERKETSSHSSVQNSLYFVCKKTSD